nr:DNA methyltransferase [Nitrosomonas nitrosa]
MKLRPTPIRDLAVRTVPTQSLRANPANARTHSKAQIEKIAASIKTFGWMNPLIVDDGNRVLCGHGRLAAAKLLGMAKVPVIAIGDLTPEQKRAYVLADNRLAELAGWDRPLVAIEIKELMALDFDVGVIGFEPPAIDVMLNDLDEQPEPEDPLPGLLRGAATTKPGDVWILGAHRLLCGDTTESASFTALMAGHQAQLVITDPPYNVRIADISGLGKVKHREFAMASGEMSEERFVAFLETVMAQLVKHTVGGSLHYIFMDWRHLYALLTAGRRRYTELKNLCVWAKSNGGMGSLYRSQHELIAVFKNGAAPHVNNVGLGKHGRNRSNVWPFAGVNGFRAGRDADLGDHPTVKPVAMIVEAIKDSSARGDIVLDCFAGTGTTILAAERTGRRAYAMEIDPLYVDVAIERWQAATGRDAVLQSTGETYDALKAGLDGGIAEPEPKPKPNSKKGARR